MPERRSATKRTSPKDYGLHGLLTYRLLVLSNTLGKGAMRLYATRYGISLAEWRMLAALAIEAPLSVNALAAAIRADKSWVSRTVASVVERGLAVVREVPTDARRTEIELTAAGRALYAKILPEALARQRRLMSVLSMAERRAVDSILNKLQQAADELMTPLEEQESA
jgi:DNA-binding MarR family transcriptional regulator